MANYEGLWDTLRYVANPVGGIVEGLFSDKFNPLDAVDTYIDTGQNLNNVMESEYSNTPGLTKSGYKSYPDRDKLEEELNMFGNKRIIASLFGQPEPEPQALISMNPGKVHSTDDSVMAAAYNPVFNENRVPYDKYIRGMGDEPDYHRYPSIIRMSSDDNTFDQILNARHEVDHTQFIKAPGDATKLLGKYGSMEDSDEYYGLATEVSARLAEAEAIHDMLQAGLSGENKLRALSRLNSLKTEIIPYLSEYMKNYPKDVRANMFIDLSSEYPTVEYQPLSSAMDQ